MARPSYLLFLLSINSSIQAISFGTLHQQPRKQKHGLAASMAIITTLCSFRFRRKSSSPSPPQPPPPSEPIELAKEMDSPTPTPPSITVPHAENDENNEVHVMELPLPPAMQQPKDPLVSDNLKRVTSERRTSFSLSIKMPRTLSVARNWDHIKDQIKEEKNKLKTEDSVWMKTIILGEKCVPDEEDDPVIYEGKGKRIAAYHTKKHGSISISRQCSSIDHDAFSLHVAQPQDEKINNT